MVDWFQMSPRHRHGESGHNFVKPQIDSSFGALERTFEALERTSETFERTFRSFERKTNRVSLTFSSYGWLISFEDRSQRSPLPQSIGRAGCRRRSVSLWRNMSGRNRKTIVGENGLFRTAWLPKESVEKMGLLGIKSVSLRPQSIEWIYEKVNVYDDGLAVAGRLFKRPAHRA